MDKVFIQQLAVDAVIGVYDWERTIRQPLLLDIEMQWDNKPAARSDNIALALDYFEVSNKVTKFVQTSSFQLIEAIAEGVADLIHHEFNVAEIMVRVFKPTAVESAQSVGVEISRKYVAQ